MTSPSTQAADAPAPDIAHTIIVGHDEKPFDIFVIDLGDRQLVGRKQPEAWRPGIDPERKGCLVALSALMGELRFVESTDDSYRVGIAPRDPAELAAMVRAHAGAIELRYPLRRLRDRRETAQQGDYWNERAEDPASLDDDEIFLRDESERYVVPLLSPGARLFDPACSSGTYLATLARAVPGAWTIGQDLSPAMADIAATRLDEVHCGDALNPACPPGSVDFFVCRHLNLDVLTSAQAAAQLAPLVACLRPGGIALIFGHTPVLVDARQMREAGLEIIRQVGWTPGGHALFQFYLLRKTA